MKNKNQKEIDMIVEIMDRVNPWDCKTWKNYYKKCAEEILTKLKENEIVIAKGRVNRSNYNVPYFEIVNSFGELGIRFKGNLTNSKGFKDMVSLDDENIILTARVVKDE